MPQGIALKHNGSLVCKLQAVGEVYGFIAVLSIQE
jgi:hypothetical protein